MKVHIVRHLEEEMIRLPGKFKIKLYHWQESTTQVKIFWFYIHMKNLNLTHKSALKLAIYTPVKKHKLIVFRLWPHRVCKTLISTLVS
jgi:hypothetical protein